MAKDIIDLTIKLPDRKVEAVQEDALRMLRKGTKTS